MRQRGSALVEALVAAALACVALAVLAAGGHSAAQAFSRIREHTTALALATERLESLHASPLQDGSDLVGAHGILFARAWTMRGGRGLPIALRVQVSWRDRVLWLEGKTWP